jgi:ATP-dependent Clp protease protease subunit
MSGTARIDLFDTIGSGFFGNGTKAADVIAAIGRAKGADELEIHVGSPGGSVWDGISIYNALRQFPGRKTVFVDGLAASIASVIALAGDRRVTSRSAMWMVHDPSAFASCTSAEMHRLGDRLEQIRDTMLTIYTERTGLARAAVSTMMAAETWMTAEEAKARGFSHETANDGPTASATASAVALMGAYRKLPPTFAAICASARTSTVPATGSTLSAAEREIARMSGATPEAYLAARAAREAGAPALTAAERQQELNQIARFTGVPRR